MRKFLFYREQYAEAYKHYIESETVFAKYKRLIVNMKRKYAADKIKSKSYNIKGLTYTPAFIEYDTSYREDGFGITFHFLATPDSIRAAFPLSRKEEKIVSEYQKNIYNLISNSLLLSPTLNGELVERCRKDYLCELWNLKNHIELMFRAAFNFSPEDILEEDFIVRGYKIENENITLW